MKETSAAILRQMQIKMKFWFCIFYLIFTIQSPLTLSLPQEDPTAKSIEPIDKPKHVNNDEVKSIIDSENSLTHKITSSGINSLGALQKAGSSTVNNLGWFTTNLLGSTFRLLSNTMQTIKDVSSNTLNAGFRVGKNTIKLADGAVRGAVGLVVSGANGVEDRLKTVTTLLKDVSKNPNAVSLSQYLVPPAISSINPSSLLPSSDVTKFVYDVNSDSIQTIYNSTLASTGSVGWLASTSLGDTVKILGNTVELVSNLGDTALNTGYQLGENGASLTGSLLGSGYNFIENGLSSVGDQMEQVSKSFKDKILPQKLVEVPLSDITAQPSTM